MSKVAQLAESDSAAAVAEKLGMSRSQVNRLAAAGDLPVIAKAPGVRGAYLFDKIAIDRLAAERAS